MRGSPVVITLALAFVVSASDAEAKLDLYVDKSTQQISVVQNGALLYVWPVSTGRDRFSTPSGVYKPERLELNWFSRAYYNSPMPYAIFFHNGYAIHGSYDIAQLGGPASHGCVRLHPQDAALLFEMVEQEGPANTTIVIGGESPPDPRLPQYGDWDEPFRPPYPGNGGIPREARSPGPKMQPYYEPNRYSEKMQPYYDPNRYSEKVQPYYDPNRYSEKMQPYYDPNRYSEKVQPYYDPNRYNDWPVQRRVDNGRLAMRSPYPLSRPPAPRRDAEQPAEPHPTSRGSNRPATMATAPATTAMASVKSSSKCPNCTPKPDPDEAAHRHSTPREPAAPQEPAKSQNEAITKNQIEAMKSPAPESRSAEQSQPSLGYKVLPKSYWTGASWRWRLKPEQEGQ